MPRRFLQVALIASVFAVSPAQAQTPAPESASHWGIAANVAPSWNVPDALRVAFDVERVDVRGTDLEIGFVRGRDLGGDWGVSLVRKRFGNGSQVDSVTPFCFGDFGCADDGVRYVLRDVSLLGLAIHKYVPFFTIKRRVQAGLNFGGGVAQVRGRAEQHIFSPDLVNDPRTGYLRSVRQAESISEVDAREAFVGRLKTLPLAKLEFAVAGLVAPGLKVRVGGGLNFPSYPAVNVTASYLFGAR